MNREIKFRAWDTFNERMVYEPYYFRQAEPGNKDPMEYAEYWQDVDDGVWRPCHIMQFTGLLDKNGKEIYEGDIITDTANKINSREWNAEVVWSDIGFSLSECHPTERSLWELAERGRLEVIGNIYENPEPI